MKTKNLIIALLVCTIFSISLVTVLFALSEDSIQRNNSFLRRYPHHPATKQQVLDIKYNSYYIAGVTKDRIYLGNSTAPLHLLSLNKELKDTIHIQLNIKDHEQYAFGSVKIDIRPPYFYLSDGTVPIIYRGKLGEWNAEPLMQGSAFFSQIKTIAEKDFIIRARSSASNENVLGKISIQDSTRVKLFPSLLEKQIDGVFDTDGMLLYNEELRKSIYVYFYRNEIIVADTSLNLVNRQRTIDTVSMAQLEIAKVKSKNKHTLRPKALLVNKRASTSGNYLFIHSDRLGKYEAEEMLGQASIIDVYDLTKNTYKLSFYLYNQQGEKMREFQLFDHFLIALMGNYIVTYKLKPDYFKLEKEIKKISADIRSKTENL